MGTIAEEITRIQTAKSNIKTAIQNKGVAVGDITIDGYADKINQIVVGEGSGSGSSKWMMPDGTRFRESTWALFDGSAIDTSNMTSFNFLFSKCSSLKTINNIKDWNTSKVTSLLYTFGNSSFITALDLSNWDVSNVWSMNSTFDGCSNLTSVNTTNWNTKELSTMSNTFYSCYNLSTIEGIENWNVSKVSSMSYMFAYSGLISLDLSNWSPPTTCDFNNMFRTCSSLISLDVSSFDFSNTTMTYFIAGCSNLVDFNCGKNIKTTMDISSCSSLSVDSIMSIINNYYDYTANGLSTANTLYMSQAQADKLTDEQKAVLTNKGVSFSIS